MNYININTQQTTIPSTIGITMGVTWYNSEEMLKGLGWRIRPELPEPAEGYERLSLRYVEGDGTTASAEYTDTLIQDRLNREAAEALAFASYGTLTGTFSKTNGLPAGYSLNMNYSGSNQIALTSP